MVQWKGNIQREQAGEKAANLESIEKFDVPNFFVLTKSGVENLLESKDPNSISNQRISEDVIEDVKEAYQDIGVSSEVRTASGEARNLVGNQRESQRVSVRISSNDNLAEYKLNVGASGLKEAIRTVLSSYFKENSDVPAIIFQKMIEPEYSGALIRKYNHRTSLVEIVEGLGHSLEEGITVPEFYLLENSSLKEKRIPGRQAKVSRNPMNGQRRTRTVSKGSPTFKDSEIEDLMRKVKREGLSVKFVYKRGSFYVVDAFKSASMNTEPDLEALKVSEGEITGEEGRDYILSEETERTKLPLVAKNGGYTSTDSQYKRKQGEPAVVSLKNTDKIRSEDEKTDRKNRNTRTEETKSRNTSETPEQPIVSQVSAIEIRSYQHFPELADNPFSLHDSEEKFADDCEQILSNEPEMIDARDINSKALTKCLEILNEVKVLALDQLDDEMVRTLVENQVEMVAVPEKEVESVRKKVLREEKRFIMDNLRN